MAAVILSIANGKKLQDRNDISFVSRDEAGRPMPWRVPHDPNGFWEDGLKVGARHFSEVAALSAVHEFEAYHAIHSAINSHGWQTGGWGIEEGFSKALAKAAMVGLRVLREGGVPFDIDAAREAAE